MSSLSHARRLTRAAAFLGAALVAAQAAPASAQTTLGDGVNPAPATACPAPNPPAAASPVVVNAFTFTSTTGDSINQVRVQLAPTNAWQLIDRIEIRNAGLGVLHASKAPLADGEVISLTTPITVAANAAPAGYVVAIIPKSHAAMPRTDAGQAVAVTARITHFASTKTKVLADTASGVVTLDNLAPANVVWDSATSTATGVDLRWKGSQSVVVLRKVGGPVTDGVTEGATYTAGAVLAGGAQVAYAGTSDRLVENVATRRPYYYRVFSRDACGNYSPGVSVGPLTPDDQISEGDAARPSYRAVVGLLNPLSGTVNSPFRVQVRVFSPKSAGGAIQPIGAVELGVDSGSGYVWTALQRNAAYGSAADSGIWEALPDGFSIPTPGSYTIRARAYSSASPNPVYSAAVGVVVSPVKGDGNLLVRDNANQLCQDCHTGIRTHSSEFTGTEQGSWYVGCRSCHAPHGTTNAGLVATEITPPAVRGNYGPSKVVFSNVPGYSPTGGAANPAQGAYANGDPDLAPGSAHTGVCQVCHTTTQYWTRTGAVSDHYGDQKCTSCHSHTQGMAASCNGCHGDPGRASLAGADGLQNAAPPRSASGATAATDQAVGAHLAHVNAATYRSQPLGCAECHPSPNTHQDTPGEADIAFGALASLGSSPTYNPATSSCSATYCHGATLTGGANVTPGWNTGDTIGCASCHGAPPPVSASADENHPQNAACATCHGAGYELTGVSGVAKNTHVDGAFNGPDFDCVACHGDLSAAGPVLAGDPLAAPGINANAVDTRGTGWTAVGSRGVGAHRAHLAGTMAPPFACSECHPQPANGDVLHADAVAAVSFGVIAKDGTRLSPQWQTSDLTCASVYCHSNGNASASVFATPTWTTSTDLTCTSCHAAGGSATTLSAAHGTHTGDYAYGCARCHESTTVDGATIVAGGGAHVNAQPDVDFDASGPDNSGGTFAAAGKTCASTYCHSNGTDRTAPYASPASLAWTSAATCTSCHGGSASSTAPMATGAHDSHVTVATAIGGAASTNMACGVCHGGTVAAGTDAPITTRANHVDQAADVVIDATYGGTFTAAAEGQGSCSATYCHSSGQATPQTYAVAWNATLGCNGCHGRHSDNAFASIAGEPNYASSNSHRKHVSAATNCADCHAGTVTPAGTAILSTSTKHLDKTRNVDIASAYDTNGATSNYSPATKTCNNISCHGSGTPVWGSTALACGDCHLSTAADASSWDIDDGVATNINSNEWTTVGHGSSAKFAGAQSCFYCHDQSDSVNAGHKVPTNPFRLRGASVGGVTGVFDAGASNGNAVCLNCHGSGVDAGVDPDGAGGLALQNSAITVGAWHAGAGHGAGNDGGSRCWDCHDPHGDLANQAMIGKDVIRDASDPYGLVATRPAVDVVLAQQVTGTDYAKSAAPFNGICNACHVSAAHYTQTAGDGHFANQKCTACHAHHQPTSLAFARTPDSACSSCHNAPPTGGAHAKHLEAGAASVPATYAGTGAAPTATAYSYACARCHDGTHYNNNANPLVTEVSFQTGGGTYTAGATATNQTNAISGLTFRNTNGSCAATYCHDPQGAAYSPANPTWVAGALACNACHDDAVATTLPGKHAQHVNAATYGIGCNRCHSATTTNGTSVTNKAEHADGTKDVAFDGFNPAALAYSAPGCSSLYCHSDGQPLGAAAPTYKNPAWNAATWPADCTGCHGGDAGSAAAIATNKHGQHLAAGHGCVDCHNTTVTGNRSLVSPPAQHVDGGAKDVGFAARAGGQTSAAYSSPTCSAVYCHSSGEDAGGARNVSYKSVAWNQAGTLDCKGCHGAESGAGSFVSIAGEPNYGNGVGIADANSHGAHVDAATDCATCHNGFVDASGTATAGTKHTDGVRDVALAGVGASAAWASGTKTCSSVACHGNAPVVWGSAVGCRSCHGASGAGDQDVDDYTFTSLTSPGTLSKIDLDDWASYGHGRQTAYPESGNAGADLDRSGATAIDGCVYCHSSAVAHGNANNPFRLANIVDGGDAGTTAGDSAAEKVGACTVCHGGAGYDPDGAGPLPAKTATRGIDATHFMAAHVSSTIRGGELCWDCHDPHGDYNYASGQPLAYMIEENPVMNHAAATTVTAWGRPAISLAPTPDFRAAGDGTAAWGWGDYVRSTLNGATYRGICQVCHTNTNTLNFRQNLYTATHFNTAGRCTGCHSHDQPPSNAFNAAEPTAASAQCGTCHSGIWSLATTSASKHTVQVDTGTDNGQDWGTATTLQGVTNRSCVNMCHSNHPHDLNSGTVSATHEANLYANPTTAATRADNSATRSTTNRAKTDFDPASNSGMCVNCHVKPVASGRPVFSGTNFGASAHDFTSTASPAYTWEYNLHDGGKFQRNCTKCHASQAEGKTPSSGGTGIAAVHGTTDPTLLAGAVRPAATNNTTTPAAFVCYNCHGSTASPAAGAQGNRSGKNVWSATQTTYYHPVNTDNAHDSAAERSATFNGGRFSGANRHVNCIDCHGPHEAKAGRFNRTTTANATRNNITNVPALAGATGVPFSYSTTAVPGACATNPSLPNTCWPATTSANYGAITAATKEYEVCFKCHTAFAFGSTYPTAPATGASGMQQTDIGTEFNPALVRSGHPIVTGLNNYANSPTPKALAATQLVAPWNTNRGTQTMLCTDCHNTEAATTAVQGPHGSAVRFMLAGTNKRWPYQANGTTLWTLDNTTTSSGTADGMFCLNCHPNPQTSNGIHSEYRIAESSTKHPRTCTGCHIRIPHGGKVSRLIVTGNAPARYKVGTPFLDDFRKAAAPNWGTGGYSSSNFDDNSSCNRHNSTTPTERW